MNTSSAYATLLLICLAAALCASPTWATSRHPGAARTLLDGVTLQKFDSLVSLTRPDGITLPSLYNSLRNTFNGYFTEEPAVNSPAESPAGTVQEGRVLAEEAGDDLEIFMLSSPDGSRRLHQAKATAVQKTAVPAPPAQQAAAAQFLASRTSAPVLVDMTGSQLEKTLLAPPNANGQRAKIEGPVDTGNAPVFDGSGKLVSGGRRLSQSEAGRLSTGQRVSLQPAPQQVNTPAIVPGRVSIDSAGRAAGSSSAATFDAFGRPLSQTLGGRKLSQTPAKKAAASTTPAQQASASQFLASRTSAPIVVDMTGSQMEKTLLAGPNANGQRAKIEGPVDTGNAPVFDSSGKLVSSGRRLSQTSVAAAKKTAAPAAPGQQAAAAQFLASRTSAPVVVDMTNSQLEKTLLAPPNANGQRAKIEGPVDTGNAPVFDGSGKLVSGGR